MSYPLSYKTVTGKSGLYAVIQDYETQLYWDEVANAWVESITSDCYLTLTESSEKGVYTGSAADLTVVNGGTYQITVFDSGDSDYQITTLITTPAKTETLLEVVNGVQRALRMPVSSGITDQLSLAIIQKVNDVLTTMLPGNSIYEHLKIKGSFATKSGTDLYRISPVNVSGISSIIYLRNPDLSFLRGPLSDSDFRALKDIYNAEFNYTMPTVFRIAGFDGGYPMVELFNNPDDTYIISFEAVRKLPKLTAATDYVFLPDVARLGATMMMKMDMGRDYKMESGLFAQALEVANSEQSNVSFGDVEV